VISIFYASQTGQAQGLAGLVRQELASSSELFCMGDLSPEILLNEKKIIIVTSTFGDGEPPDQASEWMSFLRSQDEKILSHLQFSILGLGDRYYRHFCQCAKDFEKEFIRLGATAFQPRLDCEIHEEEKYLQWILELKMKESL
jgi:sulfite reductase (NADPH) flavoprotein alpha-component